VIAVALAAGVAVAEQGSATVSNVSVRILGAPGASAAAYAVGTTYSQGAYVANGGRVYFCLIPGTNGVVGPVGLGDVVSGSTTWRSVLPSTQPRRFLYVANDASNAVDVLYWSPYSPAAVGKGIRLAAGGSVAFTGLDAPQGSVQAIAPSGSVFNVSTVEW